MLDIKLTPLMLFLMLLLILIIASLFGKGFAEGFGNLTEGFTATADPFTKMTDYDTYFSNTIKLSNAVDSDFYYDKKNGNIYRPVLIDDAASSGKKVSQIVMDIRAGNNKSTFDVGTAGQTDSIKTLVTKNTFDDVTTSWKIMSNNQNAKQQLNYITWNKKTFIIIFNLKNSSETTDNSTAPTPNPKNEYNIDSIYYFDGETQVYKKDSTDNNGFKSFDLIPQSKYTAYTADKDDDGSVYEYMYDFKNKQYQFMKNVKFDMRNGNLLITGETAEYKALKNLLAAAKTNKDTAVINATSANAKSTAQASPASDAGVIPTITTAVTAVTNATTDALIAIPTSATQTQTQMKTFSDNILAANAAITAALAAIGTLTTVSAAATTIKDAADKVSTNAATLLTKIQTAYDTATTAAASTASTATTNMLTVYHRSNDSEIDPASSNIQTYTATLTSSTPEENKLTPSAKRSELIKTNKPLFVPDSIGNRNVLCFPCDTSTILISFANCFQSGEVGVKMEKIQRFLTTGPVDEHMTDATPSPTTSVSASSASGNHILDEYLKWSNYMLKTQVVPPVCPACPSCKSGSGDVCTGCGGNGGSGTKSGDGNSLAFKNSNSVADVKGPSSAVASVGKSAGGVLEKTVDTTGNVLGGATNLAAGAVGMTGGLIGGTVGMAGNLVGGTVNAATNLLNSVGSTVSNAFSNDASRVGYNQSYQGNQQLQNGYNRNNTGIMPKQQQSNNAYNMGTQAGVPIDTYSYNGALQSKGSNFRPLTANFSAFSK